MCRVCTGRHGGGGRLEDAVRDRAVQFVLVLPGEQGRTNCCMIKLILLTNGYVGGGHHERRADAE